MTTHREFADKVAGMLDEAGVQYERDVPIDRLNGQITDLRHQPRTRTRDPEVVADIEVVVSALMELREAGVENLWAQGDILAAWRPRRLEPRAARHVASQVGCSGSWVRRLWLASRRFPPMHRESLPPPISWWHYELAAKADAPINPPRWWKEIVNGSELRTAHDVWVEAAARHDWSVDTLRAQIAEACGHEATLRERLVRDVAACRRKMQALWEEAQAEPEPEWSDEDERDDLLDALASLRGSADALGMWLDGPG